MAYTENQQKAIDKGEGNLMVSASAGSGKTTVMVERILSLIERGTDVTEILAITFTRLAAAEMREKLRLKICDRLASGNANSEEHLARQIRLLPLASVDTIHSFCRSLLKSYFYAADLDPAFELLSDSEAHQLKEQAIEEVFSAAYEEGSSDFLRTVRYFSKKRKDNSLKERVLALSEFADSEEDPSAWITFSQREYYTKEGRALVKKELACHLQRRVTGYAEDFADLQQRGEKLGVPEKTLAVIAEWRAALLCVAENSNLYALIAAIRSFSFDGKRINLSKEKTEEQEIWKKEIEKAKDRVSSLKDAYELFGTEEEDALRAENAAQSLTVILQLLAAYRAAYARLKRENNRVDFSDLEHFTLRLLKNEEVRRSVAARYRYVFVDEYQDVNAVQERIVSQIAHDNLFIVGDVKQSIYGFRGCNPDLFLGKMRRAKEGELIELNDNFRSAEAVIDAANAVFCRAMTEESCDISYEKTEKLIYGTTVPEQIEGNNCASAEAVYYTTKKEKGEAKATLYSVKRAAETPEAVEERAEAVCIAGLISSIVGRELIPDPEKKGQLRPVRYGDIAILSRGKKDARVLSTVEALKRRGIPAVCEVDEQILQTPEISLLLSLLLLSRNGEEDVPFVTVLLSPVGNLTETDLTIVRKGAESLLTDGERRCSFTRAAAVYAQSDNGDTPMIEREIKRKLRAVFALVQELRIKAAFLPAGELLSELISRYSLTSRFLGKRLGKRRMARVSRLLAECIDGTGKPLSVAELLRRLEKGEEEITLLESGVGDAVRIMTMHASKGLEFPVVILAGLEKQFNAMDEREAIVSSRSRGIVPLSFFEEDMSKRESALRFLVKEELARRTVKEEMRLFYVAMTRAKNRLFVVLPDTTAPTFSIARVKNARSLSDFLSKDVLKERVLEERTVENAALRTVPLTGDGNAKEAIKKVLSFTYPHEKATKTPLKRTVTQMVQAEHAAPFSGENAPQGGRDFAVTKASAPSLQKAENTAYSSPKTHTAAAAPYQNGGKADEKGGLFGSDNSLAKNSSSSQSDDLFTQSISSSQAENDALLEELDVQSALLSGDAYTEKQRKGIRMHAFLETCDLSACNEQEIEAAVRARIAEGLMEEEDLSLVPVLSRILSSPLFKSFRSMRVLREKEFTMRLYEDGIGREEGSVLQGVIDLLAIGNGEGVLVDYKYSARKAEDIWRTYRLQLDLYSRAAEAFYGIKITKKVIINLTNGETIEGRGEDLCSNTY
ncbi:MAG: UvrD-helicase domain-containing protein [Clostridia bacterium]|nr:UvrD-helicase domain-containing protein [Clostridia bacterium]